MGLEDKVGLSRDPPLRSVGMLEECVTWRRGVGWSGIGRGVLRPGRCGEGGETEQYAQGADEPWPPKAHGCYPCATPNWTGLSHANTSHTSSAATSGTSHVCCNRFSVTLPCYGLVTAFAGAKGDAKAIASPYVFIAYWGMV